MVSIHDLSKIFLRNQIVLSELEKFSAKSSPDGAIKSLADRKSNVKNISEELNFSLLKDLLPGKIPLGKVLYNLFQVLSSATDINITPQTRETLSAAIENIILLGKNIDENFLKNLIDKVGLNYEANLKKLGPDKPERGGQNSQQSKRMVRLLNDSIKGQLLKLLQELEFKLKIVQSAQSSQQLKELQSMIKIVRSSLSNIELNQILNHYSRQENGFLQIQIPYSTSETVYLYVKDNSKKNKQKGQKKKDDINLVFILNLQVMGNVRIDVRMLDKSLSCHFFAEKKNISEFVASMLPELRRKLENNYSVIHLSCDVKDNKFFEEDKPDKEMFQKEKQIISLKT